MAISLYSNKALQLDVLNVLTWEATTGRSTSGERRMRRFFCVLTGSIELVGVTLHTKDASNSWLEKRA
jgi:hypothetical protein